MAPVSDVEVEVSDGGGGGGGASLSLDDCRCPVCLEIFMEPVTLPCTHTFCKTCFLESVDKATLCCPLCRKRVSTWARLNSRNNTLVNQQLWTQIQNNFPALCQRRLSGQDAAAEDDPTASVCFPRVSEPGELRQEYEEQVTKLTEEKRAQDEEERRVSEEYIQRLLAEEEELQQEDRRRREEDERLARLLSDQLNSQEILRPADATPAKKKKEVVVGQMDRFLCPRSSKSSSSSDCSSASSFTANKENILVSECLPPQLDYYGDQSEPPSASEEEQLYRGTLRSHMTSEGGVKRKSSELETSQDEEETVSKRVFASSSSYLQGVAQWEAELLSRHQQEEEDRRLALLLQKELDQEEKKRATDRRKGSTDAYPLRQNRRERMEASTSSHTPRQSPSSSSSSVKTPKSSSPSSLKTPKSSSPSSLKTPKSSSPSSLKTPKSSSSSSSRSGKQVTLTEMFSTLSS